MLNLVQAYPGRGEAISYRLGREPGPVLNPAETFLFNRTNQFTVPHQAGGRITMIGIEAQNNHK